jgi:predicted DNA-binding transcriptional regulator YafY
VNRIERLTAIVLLLQDRPRTSEEIARGFEVSKRTILRDIQALSEMGVPVIAREGAGGGYSLPPDYRLTPLPLTAREAFLLLLSLSAITRLSDAPFAEERASLAAKLRALLPPAQLTGVEGMLSAVDVEVPERPARAPFLDALVDAAHAGRWVRLTYRSAERESVQHLFPRRISLNNGYWYCQAYSAEHAADRTYRVDRVLAVSEPAPAFAPPPLPDPPAYDDAAHPEIVATFTARGAAQAESEPQIGPRLQRHPDGTATLALRCPPADLGWYARCLAGLGPEVDVAAPQELRDRLQQIGQYLAARYAER